MQRYQTSAQRFALCTALFIISGSLMVGGCPQMDPPDDPGDGGDGGGGGGGSATARTCVGCHTDEDLLKSVAREEEPLDTENAGEG